jgi:cellulose synthase/poly-beta-1,6-N-acetylglucosamine synthase-like glycosyltransferase
MIAALLFWAAVALIVYTYVGYGLLMMLAARLRPRPVHAAPITPRVSLVLIACNEAHRIERRLRNLLDLDYPRDRIDIFVVSDGSTDDTVALAQAFEPEVRVVAFPIRRGKAAVLNDVVPRVRGELVVLADARQQFSSQALRALVADFADPAVGAVSGELTLVPDPDAALAADGTAAYWDLEKQIRRVESEVDSTLGVTGAIYAFRRKLFTPIPVTTVLDDVLVPMNIVRQGYRVVFEPAARAFDVRACALAQEFARKTRTIAGCFQLFGRERWLLDPRRNRVWFQTVSHKLARLLLPLAYVLAFAANLALLDQPFYRWTMLAELVVVALALLGAAAPRLVRRVPLGTAPYAIAFLSVATVVGFARAVTGRQAAAWTKADEVASGRERPLTPLTHGARRGGG